MEYRWSIISDSANSTVCLRKFRVGIIDIRVRLKGVELEASLGVLCNQPYMDPSTIVPVRRA